MRFNDKKFEMSETEGNLGPSSGQTQTQTQTTTETQSQEAERPILRLRKSKQKKPKHLVRWSNNVVDNENMNKKKSKICCIFHPQKEFGELSSESSDSDSNSSSGSDLEGKDNCQGHCHSEPNAYEKQPVYKNNLKVPPSAI